MTLPDAQGKHPQVFHAGSSTRAYMLAVLGLTFVGLLLRLFCARGDLWLDEIWSLQNLANIHGIGDIFWGISQDNNHYLNSLWLWLVGPNAPPVLIRLEAVICGTLTIPIAARLCGRAGAAAGLAGAALTAGSDLFVHYGSEARGYAGLLLMIFVAAEALERFLESDPASRNAGTNAARWAFGAAIGRGLWRRAFPSDDVDRSRKPFRRRLDSSRAPKAVFTSACACGDRPCHPRHSGCRAGARLRHRRHSQYA